MCHVVTERAVGELRQRPLLSFVLKKGCNKDDVM